MALNETYNLSINGDGSQLNRELDIILSKLKQIDNSNLSRPLNDYFEKLQKVQAELKDLDKVAKKNENNKVISSKDMQKSINITREVTKHVKDLHKVLQEVESTSLSKGLKVDYSSLNQAINGLKGIENRAKSTQDTLSNLSVGSDPNVKARQKELDRLNQKTKETLELERKIEESRVRSRNTTRTHNRAKASMNRAERDGRYSAKDGSEMAQVLNDVGNSNEYRTRIRDIEREEKNLAKKFREYEKKLNNLDRRFTNGETDNDSYIDRKAKLSSSQETRDRYKKQLEIEKKKLTDADVDLGKNGEIRQHFDNARVSHSRDSLQGQMAERAPSIASHAFMATTGAFGLQMMQGRSASQEIRPDLIALGQQTGSSDYTALRKNLFEASDSNGLGFKPTELVQMSSRAMQAIGDKGLPNNEEITTQLAKGARGLGIANTESYLNSMDSIMHSGAITDDSDLREFQKTVSGGIKESGMVAQADEQLKALSSMTDTMGANRELSKEDLSTITGMQGIFAESGSKSLQGEKGANALNQLQQGFKGAQQDPFLRNILGFGSEYTGITGAWQQQQDLADPSKLGENLDKVFSVYGTDTPSGEAMTGLTLTNQFGLDPQQAKEIIDLYNENGGFTEEVQDKIKQYQSNSDLDKNVEEQANQQEGKDNRNEARQEEQSMALYNSTAMLRNFQGGLAGFPPLFYQLAIATEALIASMTSSTVMMAGSVGMKRGANRMARRGSTMINTPNQPTNQQGKNNNGNKGVRTGREQNTSNTSTRESRRNRPNHKSRPNGNDSAVNRNNTPKTPNNNGGSNGIIENSMVGTPYGMFGGWFGGNTTQSDTTNERQRRYRQRPDGQSEPRYNSGQSNGKLGKLGRGIGQSFTPGRMMGALSMMPLLLNPPKDQDGSNDYSSIAMTISQMMLMDAIMNGGLGKIKDLGSKGIGKAKSLGSKGKNIYKQKGAKGIYQSTLSKGKNINKRVQNLRRKGIDKFRDTDWRGIGNKTKQFGIDKTKGISERFKDLKTKGINSAKGKYSNLSKPKGLEANTLSKTAKGAEGVLGRLGGLSGVLKKAGWIGTGISAVDIGSSLIQGDTQEASKKFGNTMSSVIDPLGLGYGKSLGDFSENLANEAQTGNSWSLWSNGDSKGDNKFQDSIVGKLLGFGNKDNNEMKAGKGGNDNQETSSSGFLLGGNNSSIFENAGQGEGLTDEQRKNLGKTGGFAPIESNNISNLKGNYEYNYKLYALLVA